MGVRIKPKIKDKIKAWRKALKLWQMLLPLGLLGVILVLIPAIYEQHRDLPSPVLNVLFDFIERFGDAILIAVVIGGVIERIIQSKEFETFARTSFVSYFGRLLPPELREGIRSYLEISIIRPSWKIIYYIEELPERPGYIKIDTEIEYDMENRSEAPAPYPFAYEVEDSLCPDMETEITYVKVGNDIHNSKWLVEELRVDKPGFKLVEKKVPQLKPSDKDRPVVYSFGAKSTEYFDRHFVSPFSASYPTVKTEFTIFYDPEKFDVTFEVTHGEEPVPVATTRDNKPGLLRTITEPILPGQGFVIRGKLKRPVGKGK